MRPFHRGLLFGACGALCIVGCINMISTYTSLFVSQDNLNTFVVEDRKFHTKSNVNSSGLSKEAYQLLQQQDMWSVADDLKARVRVLCWVMTSPINLYTKAHHVKDTWAKRCDHVLFVSDFEDKKFPTIAINVTRGRAHLTMKTMLAFDYIYKHHLNDADWFLKADDDTYVIMENLRYFLGSVSPQAPVYFGHLFTWIVKPAGYFSGGAGYVISKEALRRYGRREDTQCTSDGGEEDVEFGKCMQTLQVKAEDSTDKFGRYRFFPWTIENMTSGQYDKWYYKYAQYGANKGIESLCDYPISFHYVKPEEMYAYEYFAYHMRPYGVISGLQELNKDNHVRFV